MGGGDGAWEDGREERGGREEEGIQSMNMECILHYMTTCTYTPTCTCTSIAGDLDEISTSSILIIDSQSLSCKRNNFQ